MIERKFVLVDEKDLVHLVAFLQVSYPYVLIHSPKKGERKPLAYSDCLDDFGFYITNVYGATIYGKSGPDTVVPVLTTAELSRN